MGKHDAAMRVDAAGAAVDKNVKMRDRRIWHYFHVAAVVYMTVVVIIGFWPSYFGQLFGDFPVRNIIIHLHAVIFTGWLLLLWLLPLAAAMLIDAILNRKVHLAYLSGLIVLLLSVGRVAIWETEAWLSFGRWLLGFFV